jgi:hypothetical protein
MCEDGVCGEFDVRLVLLLRPCLAWALGFLQSVDTILTRLILYILDTASLPKLSPMRLAEGRLRLSTMSLVAS